MRIKQLISYPNPNELGMGNTNETYIRVENGLDVSDIFPPFQDIEVTESTSHKSYLLKAKDDREFRINQLGSIYRDYHVSPGDEVKFTQIDNGKKTVLFTVTNYNRVYLNVTAKGTEVVNLERLSPFAGNDKDFTLKISEGTLKISFDKSEKKRSDSPAETDFYKTTVNGVEIEKGTYYITIKDDKNVLEEVLKNKVEEYVIDDHNNSSISTYNTIPLQRIFYGAPGTGKSNTIKREVEDKGRIHFRTTFHPDSDYSTFVGCYKPTMVEAPVRDGSGHEVKEAKQEEKNRISYSFVPQAFAKAYCEAWNKYDCSENADPVFLIIEEINRGNCAQIFGDIFQLLDREMDGDRCGFSTYPIDADEDLKAFLEYGTKKDGSQWLTNKEGIKDGKLCLPPNLYIWGTMNTSDQSLFPIDSAFKRRWDWKYVKIKDGKKNWKIDIKLDDENVDWWAFIQKINAIIASMTSSADKQLGYFFCKADKDGVISTETFVSKVIFYLWNDVFKDYGFEDASLFRYKVKEGEKEVEKDLTFPDFYDEDGETVNAERLADFIRKVMNWQNREGNI